MWRSQSSCNLYETLRDSLILLFMTDLDLMEYLRCNTWIKGFFACGRRANHVFLGPSGSSFLVGVGTPRPDTRGWLAHSVKHSTSWRIASKKAQSKASSKIRSRSIRVGDVRCMVEFRKLSETGTTYPSKSCAYRVNPEKGNWTLWDRLSCCYSVAQW